jgi:hypothetical protein
MNIHYRQKASRGKTCRNEDNCKKPNCHWHHTQGCLRNGIKCRAGNDCNRNDCHFNHPYQITQYQQEQAHQIAVQQQQQIAYQQQQAMVYFQQQMVQQQMVQQQMVQPIIQQPVVQKNSKETQELGNKLHPLIQAVEPRLAGKITGMFLAGFNNGDYTKEEIEGWMTDNKLLFNKINEALAVLKDHQMRQ